MSELTPDQAITLLDECFEHYEHRLSNLSKDDISKINSLHNVHAETMVKLAEASGRMVASYSMSITSDISLHYFIRFEDDMCLFVEAFLEDDLSIDTYIQVKKNSENIFQLNDNLINCADEIGEVLKLNP